MYVECIQCKEQGEHYLNLIGISRFYKLRSNTLYTANLSLNFNCTTSHHSLEMEAYFTRSLLMLATDKAQQKSAR